MVEPNKINNFLNSWISGIIQIGKVFLENKDYKENAKKFIESHYAFDSESVLFKPTFTKEVIFRNSKDMALSYFIGGNIEEDHGFALKPWEKISIDELNILEENKLSIAMGILKLKPVNSDKITSVAFTFVFTETNSSLKIKVHHSSPL
tara:strand:- start:57 stop:503 length:447 start_codon:yes stop_codon:yes gene_type:complete